MQSINQMFRGVTSTPRLVSLPIVAGVEITTDSEGRFNLNTLHKASGLGDEKAPSKFLRNKVSKELIMELEGQTGQICTVSVEGRNGGTFAHELIAISYAGWISPSFQLKVNQVFLDYRTGKLSSASIDPIVALNDPATMRGLLLTYSEKVIALEEKVSKMEPEANAYARIARADGSMCITDAAKHLQVRPKDLFRWLHANKWIYKRAGNSHWIGYQSMLMLGLLEHKVTTIERSDGTEKIIEQVRVTSKGLVIISSALNKVTLQ